MPSAVALTTASPSQPCADQQWHVDGYHFLVRGEALQELRGHVHPGDNFTVVIALATCDGRETLVSMAIEIPPCDSPLRPQARAFIEALEAANFTGDSKAALVQDVQAAMACEPFHVQPIFIAATIVVITGFIGGYVAAGIIAYRRRRK